MEYNSLDTNIILRFLLNDVPAQTEKVVNLLTTSDRIFIIDDQAITESVYVMSTNYKLQRPEIVAYLKVLEKIININFDHALFSEVFPLYLSHPKLSFNDCYLAVKAKQSSAAPLYTLDQKLAAQLPSAKLLA